ncbi:MAG TPA: SDR family NAD(P)-dependent oxidoreductase [Byssovorax sp.]|jgi:short-subunit dehydrogenase
MKPRIILITGATSGIGRHAALHLSHRGHRVIATGRNERALAEIAAEARSSGDALETLRLDVTDQASIDAARAAVDEMTSGYGVDVLVNNAGYGALGPTEMISDADLRAQYDTNVFGLMAMTRAFVPAMRERGAGRIVNVSSLGGRYTLPLFGVYNSTKFAIESLSDALRMELRAFGVYVSLIEPGVIRTGFTDRSIVEASKVDTPDSPYAAVLARSEELRKMSDMTAVGPACISRAIERAATQRSPRARYVAPLRSELMVGFLRALPTAWADFIMRNLTGLTAKRLAPKRLAAASAPSRLGDGKRATAAALVLLVSALGVLAPRPALADGADWETLRTKDGIVVSRKDIPGSSFVAFRGEGDVDAPIQAVGDVLVDVPHEKDWIDSVVEARVLREVSPTEYIMYSHVATPSPMSDRDFVTNVVIRADGAKKRVTVRMRSVEDASSPSTKYVRAVLEDSSFVLTSIDGGKRTHVVAEIHCDPKGAIPGFIVNQFQKGWGYNTVATLRAQVGKHAAPTNARLKTMLIEKGVVDG